jgi:uncharacterized membrane protein YfhO
VDGRNLEVLRVDHALMGAVVPAGEKDLQLEFHSTYFGWGVAISLITAAMCLAALIEPTIMHHVYRVGLVNNADGT